MFAGKYASLILAAGFSTRMRQGFKPLLPIPFMDGSRSALENLARIYSAAGVSPVLLVGGQVNQAALAAEAQRLGLDYVQNPDARRGMFSTVRIGLQHLIALAPACSGCFVHPVDIPLVQRDTVRLLLAAARHHPGDVLIPEFENRQGHPPVIPAAYFAGICAMAGRDGLRGALMTLPRRPVAVGDSAILLDMDTDDDFTIVCDRAARLYAQGAPGMNQTGRGL
ncbi:NTP transferase domain-containing protein [Klebsiella sp. 2680]|uniref:nucleotidyltransferase family protein n=1 Tax=Klebsiella sp. 2680 TaxID=2018037 RepID=UPI00115C3EDC|nr:nucleotidyltransferase family protein [Klebsiella sp. 2680]